MKKRKSVSHTALRLLERYGDHDIYPEDIRAKIQKGDFEYVRRQTCSRTLCRTTLSGSQVWFVLNKLTRGLVTVLTKEQAAQHMQ